MKSIGPIAIAIGVIIVLLAALADPIGIGAEDSGFGWKQVVGVIVGALVAIAGIAINMRSRGEPRAAESERG
jgi:uncharacterized membrane protein